MQQGLPAKGPAIVERAITLTLAILSLLVLPRPASSDDPMQIAGLAPSTVQQGDGTGIVNMLNGSVMLSYAIGPSYPVDESLSYGLVLVYNSNAKHWQKREVPMSPPFDPVVYNFPRGRSPVGWGWTLHLGRLAERPSGTGYQYQTQDGVWHALRNATGEDGCLGFPECYISSDNSQIRVARDGATWKAWTKDGVEYWLQHQIATDWHCPNETWNCVRDDDFRGWYTTRILNPSGTRQVYVEYDLAGKENCIRKIWDDVRGSSTAPVISFTNVIPANPGGKGGITTAIAVTTAAGTATYSLTHDWATPTIDHCFGLLDQYDGSAHDLPLLRTLSLDTSPATLTQFVYNTANYIKDVNLPGALADVTFEWECVGYDRKPWCGTAPCSTPDDSQSYGLREKRVMRGTGLLCSDADVDCWTYTRIFGGLDCTYSSDCHGFFPAPTCPGGVERTNASKVTVTRPKQDWSSGGSRRHEEVHYFTWGGCSYPEGLVKRTEFYDGPASAAVKLRTVAYDYAYDGSAAAPRDVRVVNETTTYHTLTGDTATTVTRSLWDSLSGEFQQIDETTNEGAYAWRRTVRNITHTAADKANWFLGRVNWEEFHDRLLPTSTIRLLKRTSYLWDSDGRLLQEDREGSWSPDCGTGSPNVRVLYGWTGHEKTCQAWCGGATVPTCTSCSTTSCSPTTNRQTQTYRNGLAATKRYDGVTWFSLDRDTTTSGAVQTERDSMPAFSKGYSWDKARRVTGITYSDETAVTFAWASPTQLTWYRGTGTDRPEGSFVYDAYGRRVEQRIKPPSGSDFVRIDAFDAVGNKTWTGDWCDWSVPATCSGEQRLNYDPFNRVGLVRRSGVDQLRFTYDGLETKESYWVRNGASEVGYDRTLTSDGFGRLIRVVEVGVGGANHETTYQYDGLDRLTRVIGGPLASPDQTRTFCYDGLGNLRRATEPETGTTNYLSYDALGNLLTSQDARSVTTLRGYDCSGRILSETVSTPGFAVERRQTWDESGYLGRLTTSRYTNLDGSVVTRTFKYDGIGGRQSQIATDVAAETYVERSTYNALGLAEVRTHATSAADPFRPTVTTYNRYNRGFLTNVDSDAVPGGGFVTDIDYDPSSSISRLDFNSSGPPINVTREYDTRNRVYRITGSPGSFSTGTYAYDRSQNIYAIGSSRSYAYSARHQLVAASIGATSIAHSYDNYGNMLSRSGIEPFSVSVSRATNRITTPGYVYSTSGSLMAEPRGASYVYDGLERLHTATTLSGMANYLYDGDGHRTYASSSDSCTSPGSGTQVASLRGAGGQLSTEFEFSAGCADGVWLRDYLYADGELVGALHNSTIGTPDLYLAFGCNTEFTLIFGEPDWHACRGDGVNVYRRPNPGVYDWASPQNSSPIRAHCADGEEPTGRFTDNVSSGAYCYTIRSVHTSGELGPAGGEICHIYPTSCPCWIASTSGDASTPTEDASNSASRVPSDPCEGRPPQPVCGPPSAIPAPSFVPRYYFSDHLGTPRLVVRSNGEIVEDIELGPFGEELSAASCAQKRLFTGHERDSETDLDYMMARFYGRHFGRFLSADPIGGRAADPQSWNRYTYVSNNPLRRVDPDGKLFWDLVDIGSAAASIGTLWVKTFKGEHITAADNFNAVADSIGLVPGLPSPGTARRGIDAGASVMSAVNTGDAALDIGKQADNLVDIGKQAETGDLGKLSSLPKPPTGKGTVSPGQRDPKRVWAKSEKKTALEERGGNCEGCDQSLGIDDAKGHHKKRHADGGKTDKDNLAILCDDCHKEIHRR